MFFQKSYPALRDLAPPDASSLVVIVVIAFHVCSRWESVTNVSSSWVLDRFLRFFKTVLPCDMRNLLKSPSKQQIKNRKHTFKENLVKLSTTALCFFFGPNFDLFPLKVHLYVDRPRPWLHELGCTYIFPKLLVTCQVACRSMQICRACSPEPSWPCTSVLGYIWVQSLEKKHVLFTFLYMHCFCSPCRGPIYAFSGGLRFGNAWMVPCLQNEDVKPPMKQPQPVIWLASKKIFGVSVSSDV